MARRRAFKSIYIRGANPLTVRRLLHLTAGRSQAEVVDALLDMVAAMREDRALRKVLIRHGVERDFPG